jgi:S1-C subfamily serine protease
MFCHKCGTELPDDSLFCRKCGQSLALDSTPKPPTEATPGEPRPPHDRLLFLTVIAGALVLFLGGWLINSQWQKRATPAGPARTQSNATANSGAPARNVERPTLPTTSEPRLLSPQEIYQSESGGMALIETYDDEGRKRELGSGFVVASDGTTVTNYHVIRGAYRAMVKFNDGTVGSVDGVDAYDQNRDLAVIRLTPAPKTVLEIGDSDRVQVGDKIVAIGSPLGLQNTMTVGIVSAIRSGVIQMSAPISPGSSGGAVFDQYGKVVGVSVAFIAQGQNLNFAIPINWVKPYLNSGTPRPLFEVAAENTVTQDALNGSVTIPAGQVRSWNITVNPNKMSNAEVHGEISSTGGMDGKITLALYYQGQPVFACRERACAIHQEIANPGVYNLVLDNRASRVFARTVTGQVSLKYVK